jgi:hypothetical protein
MLHLANPNVGPPGSFTITDSDLALKDPAIAVIPPQHAFVDFCREWNKRRKANGLRELNNEEMQDRLCQRLPPGWCRDELGHATIAPGSMALTLTDVIQGTRTLAAWFAHGRKRVSEDEIVRRSYLCNQCPKHVPIHGCQGCSGHTLRSLANGIVGGRDLPTDSMLQGCSVCKCSLKAKTRLPVEDIVPHMSKEQLAQLWERCWIKEGTTP